MVQNDFLSFVLGAGINLAVVLGIVRLIYYPRNKERSFVFSFVSFGTVIYFVLQFLTSVELTLGFGFGLFAIFSVLRYRTDDLPLREMTYLFTVIGLAVMNSFLRGVDDLPKLLVANGVMIVLLYVLEHEWGFQFKASKRLVYEKIDLITPANQALLIEDLRQRTGIPIERVEIGRIDFLRDTADLTIYYDPNAPNPASVQVGEVSAALNGNRPVLPKP